jgi:hypothetical protein
MAAARAANMKLGDNQHQKKEGGSIDPPSHQPAVSVEQAADKFDVAPAQVARARRVMDKNYYRRHLDKSQLAMAAARMANMKRGGQQGNTNASVKTNPPIGGIVSESQEKEGPANWRDPPHNRSSRAIRFDRQRHGLGRRPGGRR